MLHPEIFKRDTKGKTRTWRMEEDGLGSFRTIAGIQGGNLVTSEWTLCVPTNVGRANERDAIQQSAFEVAASYEKKLTREYHRTLETIAEGAHFFKPMLAQKYEAFAPGFAQPKLDGVRCIASAAGLFSREGKPIPGAPHIFEALQPLFAAYPDIILDGELYNHDLKDDFNTIISLVKKANPDAERAQRVRDLVQYHVYDMPSHPGTFDKRSDMLNDILQNDHLEGMVFDVPTWGVSTEAEYDELHGEWMAEGYEGSMWRADLPYEQKRSNTLRKRKTFQDAEYEVVSIEEGLGNWSGMAKRVVCKLPDGRTFGAGIKGNMARAKELLTEDHKVVTVQFFQLTPDGVPRFPVATKFHGKERTL